MDGFGLTEVIMRDLNLNELEMVYGAGSSGCGDSPMPPSCGNGTKGKGTKAKGTKGKGTNKKSKRGTRGYC